MKRGKAVLLGRPRMTGRERNALFYGLLFASPAILGFLIFVLGPMVASLVLSFTNYSIFAKAKFIGLWNYQRLFSGTDPFFYKSLGVTFYYVVLSVPVYVIFAFILASLLTGKMRGKAVFRTLLYLPSIVPSVASMMIWMWLLNPDLGLVNTALGSLHLPKSLWLYSETTVVPSVVLTGIWGVGSSMVIFLAGLESIPNQFYESIEMDGGNAFHKLVGVTVPMMTPTIFFNTVLGIIGAFQIFTQAYILTNGGPNNASLFFVFFLWREAFRNTQMGYACAIAWVLFIIIMLFTALVFRSSRFWVYYEGGETA